MATLESIVLPLAESRKLVEAGMKLDTVVSWIKDGATHTRPVIVEPAVYEAVKSRIICPAPTLSELLDAIRAKCSTVEFQAVCSKDSSWKVICFKGRELEAYYANGVPTDLLAAYALLMEVTK